MSNARSTEDMVAGLLHEFEKSERAALGWHLAQVTKGKSGDERDAVIKTATDKFNDPNDDRYRKKVGRDHIEHCKKNRIGPIGKMGIDAECDIGPRDSGSRR